MHRTEEFGRPCFGVACPHRGTCRRYHLVDDAGSEAVAQGTCLRNGEYSGYAALHAVLVCRRLRPSAELIAECVAWADQVHAQGSGAMQRARA
jgi:hypothetical protein